MLVLYDFSSPQLFFAYRGEKLCARKYGWDYWILRMKQLTKKETARLSVPVLTSQPFYPQSPALRGIVPNRKWNLTLLYTSNARKEKGFFFSICIREQHEDLIKQIKKFCYKENGFTSSELIWWRAGSFNVWLDAEQIPAPQFRALSEW